MTQPRITREGIPEWIKDPEDKAPYGFDFVGLMPVGDSIASAVWTIPGALTGGAEVNAGAVATKELSGGALGNTYECNVRITSVGGVIRNRALRLVVRNL